MSASLKLVLWDLDGVLCPHNVAFFKLAPLAVAQAALSLGVPMSAAEAQEFAIANFTGQRACVWAFARRFSLDEERLFARYYAHLSADFLTASPDFQNALGRLRASMRHGVLTHAPQSWIHRALEKLQLLPFFEPDFIWGREQLGEQHKTDPQTKAILLDKFHHHALTPLQTAIVDDKSAVLEAMRDCAQTLILVSRDSPAQLPEGIRIVPDALMATALLTDR